MNILDRLNSGELHQRARAAHPDRVSADGSIHASADRARFVDWMNGQKATHGDNVRDWPAPIVAEYDARYVPSH